MKTLLAGVVVGTTVLNAQAGTENFDTSATGAPPKGWVGGVTGSGKPLWEVTEDASASSKPNVLMQSGRGDFPWCVKKDAVLTDGYVEVKFKPVSGREDQAGGVVWRWKDGNNYYVARANALENNVSLYYTEKGSRKTIRYVDAPVARGVWHALRVDFAGSSIRITFDGKTYITAQDRHIGGAGSVGVWTKSDSITQFDDFAYGVNP